MKAQTVALLFALLLVVDGQYFSSSLNGLVPRLRKRVFIEKLRELKSANNLNGNKQQLQQEIEHYLNLLQRQQEHQNSPTKFEREWQNEYEDLNSYE
jgi:hypothetical protein